MVSAPDPVVPAAFYCLAHVPDLVAYGAKPRREIAADPGYLERLRAAQRTFVEATGYPPNQTFIGNLSPEALAGIPQPWHAATQERATTGPFGEIVSQDLFYATLAMANVLEPPLVVLGAEREPPMRALLEAHRLCARLIGRWDTAPTAQLEAEITEGGALALRRDRTLQGLVRRDVRAEGRDDANLDAFTLLEALCAKASGALAVQGLLAESGLAATDVDYLISCGEEAAGDRYQRGGGGMAKSIGELCGCTSASGMDVKNFCAAPASALVTAAALVKAGIHRRIVVVGPGSLAKLGMKSPAFLANALPVLDDCLGAMAFLVAADDGASPRLRIDPGAVGLARIGASTSDEAVYRDLILAPLAALGLDMADVDRYAPELHNPEIMEFAGSGDVTRKNYRIIAAMAVRAGLIDKAGMPAFIERVGMPGFAPTQGHVPSGVPYVGHAIEAMRQGRIRRAMFVCKASLFLNRMTELYDGVSFLLEAHG